MVFAKRVFYFAAIYGLLILSPPYFLEGRIGREYPPAITHPEHFYGFIGLALRLAAATLGAGLVDLVLGTLFLIAFRRIPARP